MSETIIHQRELLRRAIRWISERRSAGAEGAPEPPIARLIEEASQRFNLSPAEEQWLLETFSR